MNYCPECAAPQLGDRHCPSCGADQFPHLQQPGGGGVASRVPKKRSRFWLPVLIVSALLSVPVLIIVVVLADGLMVRYL